jgi:LCP family protein required for cell wall assembly
MPSIDRLPLSLSRRRLLGLSFGAAAAFQAGAFDIATAQDTDQYTFLVLGLDTREENTDQRSDIIMLARVDIAANTVRTLSIPRDLYVEIPGHGPDKINAAYQIGLTLSDNLDWEVAAALTIETITHNFGIAIDHTALTDMNRFPAVIDAVGGVDVVNPYDLGEPDAATNLLFAEGPLHLDGKDALLYTRLRHQDGDGARVMRQHLVLEALLDKLQQPEMLANLPALMASLGDSIRSDIPLTTQVRLMAMLPDLTASSLAFTNIDDQLWAGYTDAGAWIYQGDWSTLPGYVQAWLDGTVE